MAVTRTNRGQRERIQRVIEQAGKKVLAVGFFEESQYPDGTPVAYIAAIQEFGYSDGNIPARPFMRPTIEAQRNAWRNTLRRGMQAVLNDRITLQHMLEQVGMQAAGQVKWTISQVHKPELSPATIAARRSRRSTPGVSIKPLVDTVYLISQVNSSVTDA